MKKIILSIAIISSLSACASHKTPDVASPNAVSGAAAHSSAPTTSSITDVAVATDPLNDVHTDLAKRSIYYPLDADAVPVADQLMLQVHAKYLSEHPNRHLDLVGSADERGSNEYNLALGQRRADGVKKFLQLGGANPAQLNAVSYGEEKPRLIGHDEAAWAQNRRTDLNYTK
jgi:peptidoglycan-associated lipoprotein